MHCNNFLSFIQKYDKMTAEQIVKEALLPDIYDIRDSKVSLRQKMEKLQSALHKDPSLGKKL